MEAFISYAREDAEFVERLREALSERGREVWVDTEGIEPADRWRGAAQRAIERCDAFVFVMSLASLRSSACMEELQYALSVNKRLIAICVEEAATDAEKPAALDELSWVMMRPGDGFDTGVDRLVHALDTDLELVHEHTEILVRARAWELAGRRASPLLRGEELRAAEEWLWRAGHGGGPSPTELQREFVMASRHAILRRNRTVAAVSGLVAVIAMALSIFALTERSDAINNQEIAQSRLLASEAEGNLGSDASLSTLLALKALKIHYTIQASRALRDALANLQTLLVLRGDTAAVASAMFNRDGSRILTASFDGRVRVWDARTGAQLLKLPEQSKLGSAAFSPDGSRILTAEGGSIRVWDAHTGKPLLTLGETNKTSYGSASFSSDSSRIVATTFDGSIPVWNAHTGARLLVLDVGLQYLVSSARFSPDGSQIVTTSDDGKVRIWDSRTGKLRTAIRNHSPNDAVFSPDGSRILITGIPTEIWDPHTGRLTDLKDPFGQPAIAQDAAFSSDGSRIVTAGGTIAIWDARDGHQIALLGGPGTNATTAEFSPDGAQIVTADYDHTARVWDAYAGDQLLMEQVSGGVRSAAFNRSGSEFVTCGGGPATVVDSRTGDRILSIKDPQGEYGAAFSPDGSKLVIADGFKIRVLHARTGEQLQTLVPEGRGLAEDPSFSPDGSRVLAVAGGSMTIWSTATWAKTMTINAKVGLVNDAVYSPNGREIATANDDGTAHVYDARTGALLKVLPTQSSAVNTVAFSPHGTRIVIGSADGTASIWNVRTGRRLVILQGSAGAVNDAAFSPDGMKVVTGGDDQTVRIWAARSGEQLVSFHDDTEPISTVAFSPDGREVLSASSAGTVRVFSTRLAGPVTAIERLARRLVTRPLTASERHLYLAGIAG